MIALKINTAKIDKNHLYQGKTGKHLDVLLMENKDGPDQYGNDGFAVQSVSKEERAKGTKGPIIGNWKRIEGKSQKPQAKTQAAPEPPADDDVPF